LSGTGFFVGFGVAIIMIAVIMFLILKVFNIEEDAWYAGAYIFAIVRAIIAF